MMFVPMLRGVYFSSATQEGSPIDRMIASVSADFGLDRGLSQQQHNSGKSFFINRLLRDVIFLESELVGVNRKVEDVTIWARRATFVVLAGIFGGCLLLWSGSIAKNQIHLNQINEHTRNHVEAYQNFDQNESDISKTLPILNPLYKASTTYDQEEHPWLSNLGLYDTSVDRTADNLYKNKLVYIYFPTFVRSN